MARILVTGASGYIGSYVAGWLQERGHEVTATARSLSPELSEALPECERRMLDVLDLAPDFEGRWDAILHTATANDILSRNFRAGVELSSLGTRNVLDLARRSGVEHVIFLSTLQVYGTELEGVIEENSPVSPASDYGLNHLFGEMVCQLESAKHSLRTTILRPANVYGCPVSRTVDRWSLVPMCFVKEVLATGRITLRSSGLQRRDFVSLRQVAAVCEAVILSEGAGSEVRNVATGRTSSVLEAAQWTAAAFEAAGLPVPRIEVQSSEPKSPNPFEVRTSVAAPILAGGTEAEMSGELSKMIDFFRDNDSVTPKSL